ncbi:hypothetical protein [Thalassotalea sp. G2M2-11]|uniref:hypothetical protein n=1 Tax=Thalassotalea sp. G2M2-11 TaxID=2787627 RepID=UPI0019D09CF7|nr:hypothetical protein [Thalassotalea sp. G2M2-11]
MNISTSCFKEYAKVVKVKFTRDKDANTLVVEDIGCADLNHFIPLIKRYAFQKNIAKISLKIKESEAVYFFQHGFKVEASILAYYGLEDALYLTYYLQASHKNNQFSDAQDAILNSSFEVEHKTNITELKQTIKVFSGYCNFHSESKHQLAFTGREMPQQHAIASNKFYAQINNKTVASAKCHYCEEQQVVEFSDFFVDLSVDPHTVIHYLLYEMAQYYASIDCITAYTIVPASSLIINAICVENDFEFGGRLTNESVCKGQLESLNTWYKQL